MKKQDTSVRNSKDLGLALAKLRKENSLTQKQLGEAAHLKQTVVSVLESGAEGVRLSTLFKVLTALGLELNIQKRKSSKWSPEDTF